MRVALVLKTDEGGLWVVPQIRELQMRGHAVTVVLPAGAGRLRVALGAHQVEVVESRFSFRFRPRLRTLVELAMLRRQLRDVAPDAIFYHLYASALAVRLSTLGLGIPRVHMVAGPLYLESLPIRTVERWLMRLDTVTIGGSEFTAQLYRRMGRPTAVSPAIPYGVDTARFKPVPIDVKEARRADLGIGDGTFVAVMVAYVYAPKRAVHRRRGIKGHDVLLEAWSAFHRVHPESHLILVGGGMDTAGEHYRSRLIAQHGLPAADRGVTWVATTDDVRTFYASADVSVSPSLSENHGAALEAGAMGIPSIVSDAGALPETVAVDTGWIVPRGDVGALVGALERAWREHVDGTLAARGSRARALVEQKFDVRRASAAVADVIESVARPRTRTAAVPARSRRDAAS
jgi:glycosyltransferase involved in cell wall biosynthesis